MTMLEKMPTGIPGLDHLLEGGIVRGNSMLLEGPPGSGKTTFGIRMLYEGVRKYNEPGLLISFEEFPKQIYEESEANGIPLAELERQGMVRVLWTPPERILEAFTGKDDLLDHIVSQLGVRRLLIDSITHFKRVATDEAKLRGVLADILNYLKIKGINAFMVKELERMDDATIAFEEYLVDASLRLHNAPGGAADDNLRSVEIRKTRGQGHKSGRHPFLLGADGVEVFPRLKPSDVGGKGPERTRVTTGIPGLDDMLGSGLFSGSLNMVAGYQGSGKSVMSFQFINEGLQNQERAIMAHFLPDQNTLLDQVESLGMNWDEAIRDGRLTLVDLGDANLPLEAVLSRIHEAIVRQSPRRLVIDSLDDILRLAPDGGAERNALRVLAAMLRRTGATGLLHRSSRSMNGDGSRQSADPGDVAECVLQLSLAEESGRLRRFAAVRKHLGSMHAKDLREFHIDGKGMFIEPNRTRVSGILSGVAQASPDEIADEVMPRLEAAMKALAGMEADALDEESMLKLWAARGELGTTDVVLREHFGLTNFSALVDQEEPEPEPEGV